MSSSHKRPLGRGQLSVRAFSFPSVGLIQAGQSPERIVQGKTATGRCRHQQRGQIGMS